MEIKFQCVNCRQENNLEYLCTSCGHPDFYVKESASLGKVIWCPKCRQRQSEIACPKCGHRHLTNTILADRAIDQMVREVSPPKTLSKVFKPEDDPVLQALRIGGLAFLPLRALAGLYWLLKLILTGISSLFKTGSRPK